MPEQTNPLFDPPIALIRSSAPTSLVERIRRSEDKTLRRLSPVSIGATGRPRVLIPDCIQEGSRVTQGFYNLLLQRESSTFQPNTECF